MLGAVIGIGNVIVAAAMAVLWRRQAERDAGAARCYGAWALAYLTFAAAASLGLFPRSDAPQGADHLGCLLAMVAAGLLWMGNAALSGVPARASRIAAAAAALFAALAGAYAASPLLGDLIIAASLGVVLAWSGLLLLRQSPFGALVGVLLLARALHVLLYPMARAYDLLPASALLGFVLNLSIGFGLVCLALFREQRNADLAVEEGRRLNEELRRESERARESGARFRDFANSASDFLWETDADGRLSYLSSNYAALTGFDAQSVLGRDLLQLLRDADADPEALQSLAAALRERRAFRELRFSLRTHGQTRWMALSGAPFRRGDAAFEGFRGSCRDVTEEIVTARSAQRLEAALENLPEAVALYDADNRLVFANRAYRDRFPSVAHVLKPGVRFEALMRAIVAAGEIADAAGREEAWLAERFARHAAPSGPFELRLRGGITLNILEARLPDGGVFTIATDVTELRRKDEQLRQAQRLEALGRLTGGVAHDFNNLLTVVAGNLDLALNEPGLSAETKRMLEAAAHAATRGAELVGRMLAFARRQPLEPRATDVNGLVTGVIELLRRTIDSQIEIVSELDPNLWPATVDAGQLESALLNLAINARDAMPQGGRLLIRTSNEAAEDGDFVVLSVADTGVGMAPEVAARVFEPFFTTKGEGSGTGLGLSMVYGFVRQSGGRIELETQPGRGACFTLRLPRSGPDGVAAAPARANASAILVVDDCDELRALCEAMLTQLGYRVTSERGAREALARLERGERFDLLLSDVALDGMSGDELLRRARAQAPDMRGLLMTGRAAAEDLRAGEAPVLAKPFDRPRLAAAVGAALQSR